MDRPFPERNPDTRRIPHHVVSQLMDPNLQWRACQVQRAWHETGRPDQRV